MIAPPHPTQVRSACERCRRQKLKCSRQQGAGSSEPCARCTRLGFFCEAGSQRKIGRPGKSTVSTASSTTTNTPGAAAAAASATSTQPPMQAAVQMPTPNPPTSVPSPVEVFSSEEASPNVLAGTSENGAHTETFLGPLDQDPSWQQVFGDGILNASGIMSLTLPQQPQILPPEGFGFSSRPLARPSDAAFESLSKINSTLHTISQTLSESWPLETMCDRPSTEGLPDVVIFQLTIQASQEFLTTLKTIHRAVGINKPNFPPNIRTTPSGNWRPSFNLENNAYAQPKLDVATTLLVVSCFVQLVELCENLLAMFEMFLRFTLGETLINEGMMFADIQIHDFTTQVCMFAEVVRHVLTQINVVIGLPGAKRFDTVWYGLLNDPKGQELLRRELGQDWIERPKKLISGIDRLKSLLEEASMLTQF